MKVKQILTWATVVFWMGIFFVHAGVGEDTYNANCSSCHGKGGNKPILPTYPKLGGQNTAYTLKQIKDFQSGARKDATMNVMVNLIKGKEKAVADYLAKQ